MFSTPLICCSIGATTVAATTSALAPGYWPDTVIVGGAISGYCATGRRKNATPPRITKTIETTDAKIGRSIKKCEIRMLDAARLFRLLRRAARRSRPRRFRSLRLGPYFLSRPCLHEAADNNAVVGADSFLNDA